MTCRTEDPLMVAGDLKMLQRTVANLVDNAITYTPAPGQVDIRAFRDKTDNARIIVVVEDSGVGIDQADLPKIFDRFFRCDQSRASGGAGLGLSLAQAIVHAHAGTIQVVSEPEKGSAFTVSLPPMH
jgi:signal transduction histidine kinase